MKRRILSISLVLTILVCLAAPLASAAPAAATGNLLDYPMPGDIQFYQDVYDILDENISLGNWISWLKDRDIINGIPDPYTGTHSCIATTTGATGTVSVADCALCQWNVGYAVADANGTLTGTISATPTIAAGTTFSFTFDELLATFPPRVQTYLNGLANGSYLQKLLYNAIKDSIPSSIPLSMIPLPAYAQSIDLTIPYSFAYSYKGTLTNNSVAVINPATVVADSWLNELNQGPVSLHVMLEDLTLTKLMPQELEDYLNTNYPIWSKYDPKNYLWGEVNKEFPTFIASAANIFIPIINGIATIRLGTELSAQEIKDMEDAFATLFLPKLNAIKSSVGADIQLETSFAPGSVRHIRLFGVSETPAAALTAPAVAVTVGGSTVAIVPTLTPAADGIVYTYAMKSGGAFASVSASGVVSPIAAGSAVVTVTATSPCGKTVTYDVAVTVNARVVIDDPIPVVPASPVVPPIISDPEVSPVVTTVVIDENPSPEIPLTPPSVLPVLPNTGGFPIAPLFGLGGFGLTGLGFLLKRRAK